MGKFSRRGSTPRQVGHSLHMRKPIASGEGGNESFNSDDDEIDLFHKNHNSFHELSNGKNNRKKSGLKPNEPDELYRIASDSNDDADEVVESNQVLSSASDESSDDDDHASDLDDGKHGENFLPSANAWGSKKKAFYDTDYVDEDYGGLNGSDVEAATLEEEEARDLQQQLVKHLALDDYGIDDIMDASTAPSTESTPTTVEGVEKVVVDYSALSEAEKLKIVKKQSPELLHLIEDYKSTRVHVSTLRPIVDAMKSGRLPMNSGLMCVQLSFESCLNYLSCLNFYLLLKSSHISGSQLNHHPVIDRIIQLKTLVEKTNNLVSPFQDEVDRLSEMLKNSDKIDFSVLAKPFHDQSKEAMVLKNRHILLKKMQKSLEKSVAATSSDNLEDNELIDALDDDDDEKRGITYQMEKNKGLLPKRKKEQRNPRVKHRNKFRKAQIKRNSQVKPHKFELQPYAGEHRGIKKNVVRSVKLK